MISIGAEKPADGLAPINTLEPLFAATAPLQRPDAAEASSDGPSHEEYSLDFAEMPDGSMGVLNCNADAQTASLPTQSPPRTELEMRIELYILRRLYHQRCLNSSASN